MPEFNEFTNKKDYENHSAEKHRLLEDIKQIIIDSKVPLEGNNIYEDGTLSLQNWKIKKQLSIFWCGKQAISKICEIGFNAGHSTMLMLLGRNKTALDFTIFDIGHHLYTKPCLNYIKSQYPHINFEYVEGDSTLTMPKWIESNQPQLGLYDVVHVDGGHSEHCISNDMKNADLLVKEGGIVIIDDTNVGHINKYVDLYLSSGKYMELEFLRARKWCHRIIKKI